MCLRLPEPWCQFCHKVDPETKKLVFDYVEHHAILIGIGDGLQPWHTDARAWELHKTDWHYYIVARGVTTFVATLTLLVGVLRVCRKQSRTTRTSRPTTS